MIWLRDFNYGFSVLIALHFKWNEPHKGTLALSQSKSPNGESLDFILTQFRAKNTSKSSMEIGDCQFYRTYKALISGKYYTSKMHSYLIM